MGEPTMQGNDDRSVAPPTTAKDAALEFFAGRELELRERVASLEADVAVYRELAVAGFDALRDLTVRYRRLQASANRVHDEYRELRQQLLLEAGVAA